MPCNSDHMQAIPNEIAASKLACVLDELAGRYVEASWWDGYHPRAYTMRITQEVRDSWARDACKQLSRMPPDAIQGLSLETQIWWRDHQKADEERRAEGDDE